MKKIFALLATAFSLSQAAQAKELKSCSVREFSKGVIGQFLFDDQSVFVRSGKPTPIRQEDCRSFSKDSGCVSFEGFKHPVKSAPWINLFFQNGTVANALGLSSSRNAGELNALKEIAQFTGVFFSEKNPCQIGKKMGTCSPIELRLTFANANEMRSQGKNGSSPQLVQYADAYVPVLSLDLIDASCDELIDSQKNKGTSRRSSSEEMTLDPALRQKLTNSLLYLAEQAGLLQ